MPNNTGCQQKRANHTTLGVSYVSEALSREIRKIGKYELPVHLCEKETQRRTQGWIRLVTRRGGRMGCQGGEETSLGSRSA